MWSAWPCGVYCPQCWQVLLALVRTVLRHFCSRCRLSFLVWGEGVCQGGGWCWGQWPWWVASFPQLGVVHLVGGMYGILVLGGVVLASRGDSAY